MKNEIMIWEGSPSQWVNFNFYLLCLVLCAAFGLGILLAIWQYYETKFHKLKITDQRIIEKRGIFSIRTDELELYRVKDITFEQPFFLRLLGLSNLVLDTTDHSNELLKIKGITNGSIVKEQLRTAVDIRRDLKGVREVDFN